MITYQTTVTGSPQVEQFLEQSGPRIIAAIYREMRIQMKELVAYVQENLIDGQMLNVRTGHGRRSLLDTATQTSDQVAGTVATDSTYPYMAMLHEGTQPHVIRPVNARALAFMGREGKMVFLRSVNHPGTKARPYLTTGLEQRQRAIIAGLTEAAEKGAVSA